MDNGDAIFFGTSRTSLNYGPRHLKRLKANPADPNSLKSAYIGRISSDKKIRWLKSIAEASYGIYAHDLERDIFGNIYISGSCQGLIHFANGQEQNQAEMGIFMVKLNQDGDIIWANTFSGLKSKVHAYYLLPRDDGKCYILGNHGQGNFGNSKLPFGGDGQYSQYLGLVSDRGQPLWATSLGGEGGKISASDMCYDSQGHVLICGNYRIMNRPNIINHGAANSGQKTKADSVTISRTNGSVQSFIGRYHKDTGEPLDIHTYGGSRMHNATAISSDEEGNIYVGLNLYGEDFAFGTKVIPAYKGTTMALAKLDKNWNCLWYKSFDTPGSDHLHDISLDGNKLYAAAMVAKGNLTMDEVQLQTRGLWSGAIFRFDPITGNCENVESWEVGNADCVAMKDGKGYAGGWFHYTMNLAGEEFTTTTDGQFNAILVRLGPPEQDPLPDSLVALDSIPEIASETQHVIEVENSSITITFWDDEEVDGDIISLKLNDHWIIRNYSLRGSPKTLSLEIEANRTNYLEMFALDEGSIPPVTSAIIIRDGNRNHQVSLRSSTSSNGQIEIRWKP